MIEARAKSDPQCLNVSYPPLATPVKIPRSVIADAFKAHKKRPGEQQQPGRASKAALTAEGKAKAKAAAKAGAKSSAKAKAKSKA